eukprot:1206363-Prymnesium_polylepis.6
MEGQVDCEDEDHEDEGHKGGGQDGGRQDGGGRGGHAGGGIDGGGLGGGGLDDEQGGHSKLQAVAQGTGTHVSCCLPREGERAASSRGQPDTAQASGRGREFTCKLPPLADLYNLSLIAIPLR